MPQRQNRADAASSAGSSYCGARVGEVFSQFVWLASSEAAICLNHKLITEPWRTTSTRTTTIGAVQVMAGVTQNGGKLAEGASLPGRAGRYDANGMLLAQQRLMR